jgi:hypothetical protein
MWRRDGGRVTRLETDFEIVANKNPCENPATRPCASTSKPEQVNEKTFFLRQFTAKKKSTDGC